MNLARRGEKERVTDLALKGMSVLDPSKTGGMALQITRTGADILGSRAGVAKAAADVSTAQTTALGDIARSTGQIASGYGAQVTQPFGEMAGYFLGRSGGLGLEDVTKNLQQAAAGIPARTY